jgi:hypothetical protein
MLSIPADSIVAENRDAEIRIAQAVLFLDAVARRDPQIERVYAVASLDPYDPKALVGAIFVWVESFIPDYFYSPFGYVLSGIGAAFLLAPWLAGFALILYAIAGLFNSPIRLLLYVPSLVYRLVLKATCILYFPLIWVIEPPYLRANYPLDSVVDSARHPYTSVGAVTGVLGLLLFIGKQLLANFSEFVSAHLPKSPAAYYLYKPQIYDFLVCISALLAIWFWFRARLLLLRANCRPIDAQRLMMLGRIKSLFSAYSLAVFILGAWPHLPRVKMVLPEWNSYLP